MRPRKDLRNVAEHDVVGCDAVVNAAAICNDACGELSSEATHEINHHGAVGLAELARGAGVPLFVQISSCSVYRAAGEGDVDESGPVSPQTAYAASKVAAERSLTRLSTPAFRPVMLRLATLFGPSPSFRSDILLNRMVGTALRRGSISVAGDGSVQRPLLHVSDAARAIAEILRADPAAVRENTYNVGVYEQNHRLADLVDLVREAFPAASLTRTPLADQRSYRVRFDRFRQAFPQWSPSTTPMDAIPGIGDQYRRISTEGLRGLDGREENDDGWGATDRRDHLSGLRNSGSLGEDFRWTGVGSTQ